MSKYLKPIPPRGMSQKDIEWLDKAARTSYYGHTAKDIWELAVKKECQLWRVGDCDGLIVTLVRETPRGKVLDIWLLAGAGLMKAAEAVHDELVVWARTLGCRAIEGRAMRKGLQPLYKKLMGEDLGIKTYFKEI